jgi:hypothetical protein
MFRFDTRLKVYLHRDPVDGRKNINGLAALVEQQSKRSITSALASIANLQAGGISCQGRSLSKSSAVFARGSTWNSLTR